MRPTKTRPPLSGASTRAKNSAARRANGNLHSSAPTAVSSPAKPARDAAPARLEGPDHDTNFIGFLH